MTEYAPSNAQTPRPNSGKAYLIAGGDTRQGRGHAQNEDSFWLPNAKWPDLQQSYPELAEGELAEGVAHKGYLYIVADGVGGQARGDEASRIAIERIPAVYYQHPGADIADSLTRAIRAANRQIYNQAQQPDYYGMSSAIVIAVIRGQELVTANLGDSRAYLLRNGSFGFAQDRALQRLTADHTWIAEQAARGILTSEEAANHPQRGVLTRALGLHLEAEPEIRAYAIAPGDRLLLCSDGVWGMIEPEIKRYLQSASPQRAAASIVNRVAELGGADDATAVVATVKAGRGVIAKLLAHPGSWIVFALVLAAILFVSGLAVRLNRVKPNPVAFIQTGEATTPSAETSLPVVALSVPTPTPQIEMTPEVTPPSTPLLQSQVQYCVSPFKNAVTYAQLFDVNCQIVQILPEGTSIDLPPTSVYKDKQCSEPMLIQIEYQGIPYRMYPWRIGRLEDGQCVPMPEWREFLKKPRDDNGLRN